MGNFALFLVFVIIEMSIILLELLRQLLKPVSFVIKNSSTDPIEA